MLTLSRPLFYSFELTPACNNQCPVCSNVFTRQLAFLSASEWRKITDQIAPHAEVLKITGGEPTLHPEFGEIIRYIGQKNISFTLFTNGRWRNPQVVIDLLTSVPQFKGFLISLHGPNVCSHEGFTHTPGSFEDTCKNIERAVLAGLSVHTSTVLTRYNWNRLQEIVSLAQTLGAKRAVFNRYLGPPVSEIEPEEWQLQAAVCELELLRNNFNNTPSENITVTYGNCIPQCFESSSSTGCWAGVASCTIDPLGNVRPCNHSPTIAGNILQESIEEIWSNKIMNRWRTLAPQQCESCTKLAICHGGCRALIEIREKDPLIRAPFHKKSNQQPFELELNEKYCPVIDCKIFPESFGHALVRGHSIVPVAHHAKAVLDNLDGQTTLKQLKEKFGQGGLNFLGSLYLRKFLYFKLTA